MGVHRHHGTHASHYRVSCTSGLLAQGMHHWARIINVKALPLAGLLLADALIMASVQRNCMHPH